MASESSSWRIVLTFVLFLFVVATFIPQPASASPLKEASALPKLKTFVQSVKNGEANSVRGVYADGLFALPVVQQSGNGSSYVSAEPNTLTQFAAALTYGNIGLLAHDFLAGAYFSQLSTGQEIQLVYGDGRIINFMVAGIYRYQAMEPNNVYSKFIDLNSHNNLSATQLFEKVYMGSTHITFQTCIEANGNSSWGRLFVIADPQPSTHQTK